MASAAEREVDASRSAPLPPTAVTLMIGCVITASAAMRVIAAAVLPVHATATVTATGARGALAVSACQRAVMTPILVPPSSPMTTSTRVATGTARILASK